MAKRGCEVKLLDGQTWMEGYALELDGQTCKNVECKLRLWND